MRRRRGEREWRQLGGGVFGSTRMRFPFERDGTGSSIVVIDSKGRTS